MNRFFLGMLIALLLVLWGTANGHAATYWVRPTGILGGCVGSATAPAGDSGYMSTVQAGIDCLAAGDTLRIRAGTYDERPVILDSHYGTSGSPIVMEGHPGDARPIIRPSSSGTPYTMTIQFYDAQTPRYLTLRGFELDDVNSSDSEAGACLYIGTPYVTMDDMVFRNCSGNGVQMFSSNLTLRNSQVLACGRVQAADRADTKGVGFYIAPAIAASFSPLAYSSNNLVEDNIVDGCRGGGGVIHYGRSDDNVVQRNIFQNAGDYSPWPWPPNAIAFRNASGVNIGGDGFVNPDGPRRNKVINNIFRNLRHASGPGAGHFLWAAHDNIIANNTYYNVDVLYQVTCQSGQNTGYIIQNNVVVTINSEWDTLATGCTGDLSGAINTNVLFVDPSAGANPFQDPNNGDFHLKSTAASLIDQGVNHAATFFTDFAGVIRPQGAGFDIGAYEFSPAGQPPVVVINSPTADPTFAVTSATIDLAGVAFSGVSVSKVTWSNAANASSGTATGTIAWAIAGITLNSGPNVITVTVTDSNGATANDQITVTYTPSDPTTLRLAMAFNEGSGATTSDSSGFANHGSLGAGVTWTPSGKYGSALVFDGKSVVTIADADSLDLRTGMSITLSVYPTETSPNPRALLAKNYVYFAYATISGYCGDGMLLGGFVVGGGNRTACHAVPLTPNVWTDLAFIWDGAFLRIYKNGTLVVTQAQSGVMDSSTGPLTIGGSQFGEYFVGRIDEPRIRSGAMTLAEIVADHATPIGAPGIEVKIKVSATGTLKVGDKPLKVSE